MQFDVRTGASTPNEQLSMSRRFERLAHTGELVGGQLILNNQRWFKGMLQQYDDCHVNVVVERKKNSRSKEQLGYLWGVVYPEVSLHTGHSPEELHEIFKAKYLKHKMGWRGVELTTVGSTTKCTTGQMAEFITNVIAEANEMGMAIPEPDELYQFN